LVFQPANKSRDQPSDQTGSCLQSLTPVVNHRSGVPKRGAKLQRRAWRNLGQLRPIWAIFKSFLQKAVCSSGGLCPALGCLACTRQRAFCSVRWWGAKECINQNKSKKGRMFQSN